MDGDTSGTGFGGYLQAIRLKRGISLEKVSEETRIGLGTLKAIEQESLDDLPAEVFLKGFIRAYSAFINADGDEAIRRYESQRDVNMKISSIEQMPKKLSTGSLWKFILALLVLALVIFISVFGMQYLHHSERSSVDPPAGDQAVPNLRAGLNPLSSRGFK
jgi:cytoskeletal protein RodZ